MDLKIRHWLHMGVLASACCRTLLRSEVGSEIFLLAMLGVNCGFKKVDWVSFLRCMSCVNALVLLRLR